jgi:glycosyltransferase involved in cell wall biosynthesis
MQVAILTANAQGGDAIGNQVAEKLAFFLDRGAQVRVFLESRQRLHPAVAPFCHAMNSSKPSGDHWEFLRAADLIVVEYAQSFGLLDLLPALAGAKPRILFDYHGVTPPHLWEPQLRERQETAGEHRGVVWCADLAFAHSRSTRRELLEYSSFPATQCACFPLSVDLDRLTAGAADQSLRTQFGIADATVLLFVGRLAVNKRVGVLVEAVARLRDHRPAVHAVVIGDSGDIYQLEARRCQELAHELGVADRLHFLGHVTESRLRDAYRSADVFVMPSVHEGFCLPVVEAMACGLAVVAARAGALPETVGDAGLTFTPDDVEDLVRQLCRLLECDGAMQGRRDRATGRRGDRTTPVVPQAAPLLPHPVAPSPRRPVTPLPRRLCVAIVACRYGQDVVGGAEASLRTMAEALYRAGHHVEVFTTCGRSETGRADECPPGTLEVAGIPVHRFGLDQRDPRRHQDAIRAILAAEGDVPAEVETTYVQNSIRSTPLLQELRRRCDELDAIITGPYLFGLPLEVARAFPEQTLLMPCFHDEPLAWLRVWAQVYGQVGGILFHSGEEQAFTEAELGLNVPGGVCVGTVLDMERSGDARWGHRLVGTDSRYLVYCGRYLAEKGVSLLLDYFRRYDEAHPGRFTLALIGEGNLAIPQLSSLRNLGFVKEHVKHDVLAGAAALVQLSRHESLSLVALEAWAQGVPVLADAGCSVLAGHLSRCGGGQAVDSFAAFADALDDLWAQPDKWQTLGNQGQEYVRREYSSWEVYTAKLEGAIRELQTPLAERLRRRGWTRAAAHARPQWRERFAALIEDVLHRPARPFREQIDIRPRAETRTVAVGEGTILVPVRVSNLGTHPALAHGPARVMIQAKVVDAHGRSCVPTSTDTPLPALLMPGRTLAAALPVLVPTTPETYEIILSATKGASDEDGNVLCAGSGRLRLIVEQSPRTNPETCCTPLLAAVHAALVDAYRRQQLPDSYVDVTQGWFATWKAWVKRKLLGNFKHAYVDVLSHQQSAFNEQVLAALHELAECCATLDTTWKLEHPAPAASAAQRFKDGHGNSMASLLRQLTEQVVGHQRELHALQARIAELERLSRPTPVRQA